jgi:hypothetical protein
MLSREDLLIQRERLRVALQNIMSWLEGCEDEGEQIPPRYMADARKAMAEVEASDYLHYKKESALPDGLDGPGGPAR